MADDRYFDGMRPSVTIWDEAARLSEFEATGYTDRFVRRIPVGESRFRGSICGLTFGRRYRVTLEGTLNEHGMFMIDGSGSLPPVTVQRLARRFERLPDPAPEWRPGDVIAIRFANGTQAPEYTYVRSARAWPGERRNLTDAEVDRRWKQGKVRPLLQAGGVPFDEERLG